jgi:hypothetical protein
MIDDPRRAAIEKEAKDVLEATMYASEAQFEFAKRWRAVDLWVGTVAASLAAVAGVGGLSKILSVAWAGGIAVASALAGAISATIAARQTTQKAAAAGSSYRSLQQDTRMFLNIDLNVTEIEVARDHLQKLVDRQQQLNHESQLPSNAAWKRAKKQVEGGSQTYETDKG